MDDTNLFVPLKESLLHLMTPHPPWKPYLNCQVGTFGHLDEDSQKKNSGLQSSYSFSNEDNVLFIMV